MASNDITEVSREMVWRPSYRGFLVYYIAFAVAFFGPMINPAVGVPVWLGVLLGLAVLVVFVLRKFGQEFRATPEGVKRVNYWPAAQEKLAWPEVGEIKVLRGLTQTLLNVGSLLIHDKAGQPRLSWERLADPKGVKASLERRQAAFAEES